MSAFIALIPARLASTRLPNKPLADIGGLPMVVRVALRARQSGASRAIIATDASAVADAARQHGIEFVMTRADHPSGTDRLAEAAHLLGLADNEIVVNVQGDEPLIPPALVAAVATSLENQPDCAIATAAHPISSMDEYLNPNAVKVLVDAKGQATAFSRAPIPWDRDNLSNWPAQTPTALCAAFAQFPALRHIGLYAYRVSFLNAYKGLTRSPYEQIESLEQLRAMWHGYRIAVLIAQDAPPRGVDTQQDLDAVRALV